MLCPYSRPLDKPCVGSACAAWSPEYIQGRGTGQRLGFCGLASTAHRFTDPARARPITSALAIEALSNGDRIEVLGESTALVSVEAIEAAVLSGASLVVVR